MTFEEAIERFGAIRTGGAYMALCPAHADKNPSLSISAKEGRIWLNCFAGCDFKQILSATGLNPADLMNGTGKAKQEKVLAGAENLRATYDYKDENSRLRFQIQRFEEPGKGKTFRARRPDGKGGFLNGIGDVRLVPFNLPDLLEPFNHNIVIVEGEKDAVTAGEKFELVATCNPFGAGKWKEEFAEFLRGKNVTIIPDSDEPGRKHAEQVAVSLQGKAASIAICNLPERIKDLSEWPLSGESLIELIKQAPAWVGKDSAQKLGSYSTLELFTAKDIKIEWLAYPLAARGLATILDGPPKLAGKTSMYLRAIFSSRNNRPHLGFATKPMRVIYVSEQSSASLAMQAREVGFTGDEPVEELRWITREHWSRFTYPDFLDRLEKDFLVGSSYNCLFIDTWHTIARLEDENAAAQVNRAGNLTLDVATRFNLALSMSRHDRKSGGDVGLSGRSSIQLTGLVDVILHLTRIPGQEGSTQRKLQLLGRVPGLPPESIIELSEDGYRNLGDQQKPADRVELVRTWVTANPKMTAEQIVQEFWKLEVKISASTAKRLRSVATEKTP